MSTAGPSPRSVSSTNPARNGSRIKVAFDMDKLHVFDKQTELAIVH